MFVDIFPVVFFFPSFSLLFRGNWRETQRLSTVALIAWKALVSHPVCHFLSRGVVAAGNGRRSDSFRLAVRGIPEAAECLVEGIFFIHSHANGNGQLNQKLTTK